MKGTYNKRKRKINWIQSVVEVILLRWKSQKTLILISYNQILVLKTLRELFKFIIMLFRYQKGHQLKEKEEARYLSLLRVLKLILETLLCNSQESNILIRVETPSFQVVIQAQVTNTI